MALLIDSTVCNYNLQRSLSFVHISKYLYILHSVSRYICLSFVINVHSEQYKWKSRPCLKVLYTAKYLKYITAEWLVIGHSHSALKIGDRFNRLIRYARFDVSYKNIACRNPYNMIHDTFPVQNIVYLYDICAVFYTCGGGILNVSTPFRKSLARWQLRRGIFVRKILAWTTPARKKSDFKVKQILCSFLQAHWWYHDQYVNRHGNSS